MGIFSRFITVFKSNVNDLISRAEDPKKMLEQIISDMSSSIQKAKEDVAVAIADEKNLYRKYIESSRLSESWDRKAVLAVEQNNDELAMKALQEKENVSSIASDYERQWKLQKEAVEKLKLSLSQLNDKLQEASRKKNLLIARQKRAEAQDKIAKTMRGLTDTSAFDTFARMESKIDSMESKSEALAELEDHLSKSPSSMDKDFKDLEKSQNAKNRLEELKMKLHKNKD